MKTRNTKMTLLLGALLNAAFLANNAGAATVWTQEMVDELYMVHKENSSFVNDSFAGTRMTGLLMSGSDFTGANFTGTSINIATFDDTTLTGAIFSKALLSFVDFTGSNLTLAQLQSTQNWANKEIGRVFLNNLDFSSGNFSGIDFTYSEFNNAILKNANLTGAKLTKVQLNGANLAGANLTNATFDPWVNYYTDMIITGANLRGATKSGFTQAHLESTASWKNKTLGAVIFDNSTANGWNFSGQNMTGASLSAFTGIGTNFSGANLTGANLTRSYFDNADFTNANLTSAKFDDITRLTNATIAGANLRGATQNGFTQAHLESTASWKNKTLGAVIFDNSTANGWNFSGQNMTGASLSAFTGIGTNFSGANLTGANLTRSYFDNADFTNANLTSAKFDDITRLTNATIAGADLSSAIKNGFTQAHLESTASFKNKDLGAINLSNNDMRGWNFDGQDLRSAVFTNSKLDGANMSNANLSGKSLANMSMNGADLSGADMSNATFTSTTEIYGAAINGANLSNTVANGLTWEHFMGTRSYQQKNLGAVNLSGNNLAAWNLAAQNMTGANLNNTDLSYVTFKGATLAGATLANAKLDNTDFSGVVWTTPKGSLSSAMALADTASSEKWWENPGAYGSHWLWVYHDGAISSVGDDPTKATNEKHVLWNLKYVDGNVNYDRRSPDGSYAPGTTNWSYIAKQNMVWFGEYSGGTKGGGATIGAGCSYTSIDSSIGIEGPMNITLNRGESTLIFKTEPGQVPYPDDFKPILELADGAKLNLDVLGDFTEGEVFDILVIDFIRTVTVEGAEIWTNKDNIVFKINGALYTGDWNAIFDDKGFHISGTYVPEPAAYAAILGALALSLSAWRRRKARR